jgi:hypothetical protein
MYDDLSVLVNVDFRLVFPFTDTVFVCRHNHRNYETETPWPESASELYQPSDRLLLAKLVPTFEDRGCQVVSVTNPYGHILGFLDLLLSIN